MSRMDDAIDTAIPTWPRRPRESHKGDFGRSLLIGGSRGMAGAVALSGMAALRCGAGLVTIATADSCLDTVAGFHPAYMTLPLRCDAQGRIDEPQLASIEERLSYASAVAVGPGLGRSDSLSKMVKRLFDTLEAPLVVDADGLFALGPFATSATNVDARTAKCIRVLTPHVGELRRLVAAELPDRVAQEAAARSLAATHRLIVVLKGAGTLVTDGHRAWRCQTGNPGMATGGSGDVLTGMLTALLAQGLDAWSAVRLGVHLHGLAGDLAARRLTEPAMTPLDLIESLPDAIQTVYEQAQ